MANAPITPPPADDRRLRILFVCMGNICRSPMAQAILETLVRERGYADRFLVDSAGLGDWKLGETPDPRTLQVLTEHHLTVTHQARVVRPTDFDLFDMIIAMELEHIDELMAICPIPFFHHKLHLMREVDPLGPGPVPDPFRAEVEDFRAVYAILDRCCRVWLQVLTANPAPDTPMTM